MFLSIFDIITVPFGYLLDWLYQLTHSYGWSLILFAIVVKVVLLPVTAKSKRSSMKMSRMQPRMQALKKKYANDPQKQNEAIRALYKEEGVSMGGGCLWSLVPLLILLPLYSVIRYPMEYMFHETEEVANAITGALGMAANDPYGQLKAAAAIFADPTGLAGSLTALGASARTLQGLDFSFLGSIDLGAEPMFNVFSESWKWDWAHIGAFLIPVFSAGSQVLSMFITNRMNNSLITNEKGLVDKEAAKQSDAHKSGKMMLWMMPLLSLWIGYSMPAALSLYWFAQGAISIVIDTYLTKKYRKIYDAEDAARLQKALEEEALEAEKERIRAERRAANPDGITTNTSKKKLQQKQQREEEAAKAAAAAEYAAKKGIAQDDEEGAEGVPSGVNKARPNSRGRAYDPNRYSAESTEE